MTSTEGTSLLPVFDKNKDDFEPLDTESVRMLRQKERRVKIVSRFAAAVTLMLVAVGVYTNSNNSSGVDVLFADLLAMAPPGNAVKTSWKDCKEAGKQIAIDCYNVNPTDVKGCTARGKEAAKTCYKAKAKAYKGYYKGYGKAYKDLYKPPPADTPADDELFADVLAMAPPDGATEETAPFWVECKQEAKSMAAKCNLVNPTELEACKDKAKAAAKTCYKSGGKSFGKEFKDLYKPPPAPKAPADASDEEVDELFADVLAMAPPGDDSAAAAAAPFWVTCKQEGKSVFAECYKLNPVDAKGCKARGKEAAKVCYKNGGKAFGKEFKALYPKKPKSSKGDDDDDETAELYGLSEDNGDDEDDVAVDSTVATDLLAMAPPEDAADDVPLPFWKACKITAATVADDCLKVNPVDPEGCKAQGKAAGKVCYKNGGKAYKAIGKKYKDMWKPAKADPAGDAADADSLFAELLQMAPPADDEDDGPEADAPTPFWKACKETGVTVAGDCLKVNPADPEGCKTRGKEAAKSCYKVNAKEMKKFYKDMGKEMKKYYKDMGKEKKDYYKGLYKPPADDAELFADVLAMAPPEEGASVPFWKACKEQGKNVATDCYNLNPVDKKACAARGKEAAKVCYKPEGKAFGRGMKDYYKGIGEQYKDLYKPKTAAEDLDVDVLGSSSGPDVDWAECNGIEEHEGKAAAKACYKKIVEAYKNYYSHNGH